MILGDTSVWVDHLRGGVPGLAKLLDGGHVLMHAFVLGELACGNLRNRGTVLDLLGKLPHARSVTNGEALGFIERQALMGRGIGYVDVHLLASVWLESPAQLWTRDRRLGAVAKDLGVMALES